MVQAGAGDLPRRRVGPPPALVYSRMPRGIRTGLLRDVRGAVYVEFIIAFLPMLVMFLCLWQLSILFTTKLMVDHAAITAARSGAVLVAESAKKANDSGGASTVNQMTSSRTDLIKHAIDIPLAPLIISGTISSIKVEYPKPTDRGGAHAMPGKSYPPMQGHTVTMFLVPV